jgi:hypothetical protein
LFYSQRILDAGLEAGALKTDIFATAAKTQAAVLDRW